ncbi:MAG TPA: hypothetical protein VEY91_11870 [Candidatus Limnocylindria bacterium]|nr:hypothetical protein [Candidatus Limnocylindria bacterium]
MASLDFTTAATPPDSTDAPGASAAAHPDHGATTAPPWNSPHAVPVERTWETALRLPGRIVSLPLRALGFVSERFLLRVEDASVVPKAAYLYSALPYAGVFVTPASLGDRTGFGATVRIVPPPIRNHLQAEVSGSTRNYSSTRIAASAGPARLAYRYDWRPQERFFGVGLRASSDDTTAYAWQTEQVRFGLEYPWMRSGQPSPRTQVSAWVGPRSIVVRRGRDPDVVSFEQEFPGLAPGQLDRRFEHLVYGGRAQVDRRTGAPHWSHGYRVALQIERFDQPIEAFALRSAAAASPSFTRKRLEAEWGFSFMRDPRTIRLGWVVVDQDAASDSVLLLPDLARLGGAQGLAGFEPGRFHHRDALAMKLSYIFPMAEHFEFDLHTEVGGVYADVMEDPRLDDLETSYGVALRPRSKETVLGSIGVDWSREKVRIRYSLGGVE